METIGSIPSVPYSTKLRELGNLTDPTPLRWTPV